TLTPRNLGIQPSGNVVAEVRGSDPDAGIVVVGGHLDSWDLGTGAIDNAAGVAITAAAAKRIMESGRPRRTIRIVWFGAEEVGGHGGDAYRAAHKDERIVFVSESDFGADRIWRMDPGFAAANGALADRVAAALAPLGIARSTQPATAGADLGDWVTAGVAAIDLQQDGTRYFDYHHTPDDTLDKIDPEQLRQNVAAWTAMLALVANAPEEIVAAKP
ncbi:MAG TPA: M20/M25/M40 family metallo-hydrolase, partial [Allosphingosinicella sp.]|nr:M20/M25/M40 family metallo-hydrolase [Allosphingosinicella sp.]